MGNPFQEQFLKAGLVTEKQVRQANQKKNKRKPQQPKKQRGQPDQATLKAREAAARKAEHDRKLNLRKQEQSRKKAISIEIDQLIRDNRIERGKACEIGYQFEHRGKINKLYVDAKMKQQIIDGKLGIARIEGRYELVPLSTAQKIQQRNDQRVVLFDALAETPDPQDPYAEYQVPDDLVW
jgi:hypothetical protein